jgi:beta-glucosidase
MTHPLLDGRLRLGVGIEDTFVPNVGLGRRSLDEYELTQHYGNWEADLELVADSAARLLRYGLPWYRINPEPGRFVWSWADRVVDALAELDAEVIVDLVHYGTPQWLDNQFLNLGYPQAVAEFAFRVAERYGDRLTAWTPLNEPQWTARLCGELGTWPPALTGHDGYLQVMTAVCRGISLTQQAIQAAAPGSTIVHVEASFRYDVSPGADPAEADLLSQRRFLATDLLTGKVDDGHPLAGYLERHGVRESDLSWLRDNPAIPDILGMNYYPMWSTMAYTSFAGATVAAERDDDTVGLEDVLRTASARYGIPVMVTETSFEGTVQAQAAWLQRSVATVEALRSEIDIVGYTWWPFLDQVRWQYREALDSVADQLHQLGLVSLIPDEIGRLHRRPNLLLERFRELSLAASSAPPQTKEANA